ncbi:decaprenyl-phosphate phosphoribosyltransferase [candidate division KSB1 bacterium]
MKQLKALIIAMRPYQWVKNILVFAGLIFSLSAMDWYKLSLTFGAFLVFCAISSSIYLFNDLRDIEEDKKHPVKKKRPLPSGKLNVNLAKGSMVVLMILAFGFSYYINSFLTLIIFTYFILNIGYSMGLKKIVILDVMIVSIGFLLRAVAGAIVIQVEVSHWLFLCSILLALLITFGKRRHEIYLLNSTAGDHRHSLKEYSLPFLDVMMSISGACAIIAFSLYTMSEETTTRFGTDWLLYTTPFVLFGVFRYFYLIQIKSKGGDPTKMLITDIPSIINGILWLGMIFAIIYGYDHFIDSIS